MKRTTTKVAALVVFSLLSPVLVAQNQNIQYEYLLDFHTPNVRKVIQIPDVMGYKALKCDFHIHTIYSDGIVTPRERVNEAWREGLDVIAITDHIPLGDRPDANHNRAYEEALSTAESKGITLIHGTEFTSSKPVGHLNFLFVNDANRYLPASTTITEDEARKFVELAAHDGAYVIYNHPGWPDKNSDLFPFQKELLKKKKIHAVEVFNGAEFYPVAMDYCNEYGIAHVSNSDIHAYVGSKYDLTRTNRNITLVLAKDNSIESVKEALFANRTIALAGRMITGQEHILKALLNASIKVRKYESTEFNWKAEIENVSDLHFILEDPLMDIQELPARSIIQLSGQNKDQLSLYRIKNMYTASNTNLVVPLDMLVSQENYVPMPYIAQNTTMVASSTTFELKAGLGCDVYYTIDGTKPTRSSMKYTTPIKLDNSAVIKAVAYKDGNESRLFERQVILTTPVEAFKGKVGKSGVNYSYYEGEFQSVYEFESRGKFVDDGTMPEIDITKAPADDYFGYIFTGYIYVPADGQYTFSTYSDDGSTLRISGVKLIDNDGSHGLTKVSGDIVLKKGYHPFELRFMEDYEGQELRFLWKIPGSEEQYIPASNIFMVK